jgi:hypothetical protein
MVYVSFFRMTPPYVDSDGLCVTIQTDISLYVDSDCLFVIFQTDNSLYVDSDGLCVIFQNDTSLIDSLKNDK